jgi:MFS family permease
VGFASIVAQLLGGLLVAMDLFGWSWRLIILVNIPIGLVTVDLIGVGLATLGGVGPSGMRCNAFDSYPGLCHHHSWLICCACGVDRAGQRVARETTTGWWPAAASQPSGGS